MLPRPLSFRAIGGRGSSWSSSIRGASGGEFIVVVEVFARWARLTGRLLAVIGERSPSDWRRCGAGIKRPAAALKGYATAATTGFCGGDSSERYRSETT